MKATTLKENQQKFQTGMSLYIKTVLAERKNENAKIFKNF
jgi:hypothetical protein